MLLHKAFRKTLTPAFVAFHRQNLKKFELQAKNFRAIQNKILEKSLRNVSGSRFAKDFALSRGLGVDGFRKAFPITTYTDYEAYIEQLKLGDNSALFAKDVRPIFFGLTSGTTNASKFIPLLKSSLKDYKRDWLTWASALAIDHPELAQASVVNLASPCVDFKTASGVPCGNVSGLILRHIYQWTKYMSVVNPAILEISDDYKRYYLIARLALARDDIKTFTTANPSTLIQFAKFLQTNREALIRDVKDGTLLNSLEYPNSLLEKLRYPLRASNKSWVKHLESSTFLPKDIWGDIPLLAVWTGGSLASYLPCLSKYYGSSSLRDPGLTATEARMSIPLKDSCSAGVLAFQTNYLEFYPSGEKTNILLPEQLEVGAEYNILITSKNGLFRYDIGDVVVCREFWRGLPVIEFLNKGESIGNITGEKLSAYQVDQAVLSLSQQYDLHLESYLFAPSWGDPPGYQLFLEQDQADKLSRVQMDYLDNQLSVLNIEYQSKRKSGRLAMLDLKTVPQGTLQKFYESRPRSLGSNAEQLKPQRILKNVSETEDFLTWAR